LGILYLTFDGLTDPLGQSQVLPYLKALAAQNYQITIISCEKPGKFKTGQATILSIVNKAGIRWIPVPYSNRIPLLSGYLNTLRMRRKAFQTARAGSFSLVHCRSYLSALIGLRLKHKLGLKFVFDMRGFWADERIDGGIWRKTNLLHRLAYAFFKKKEKLFFSEADHIVSLTEAGKKEIARIMTGLPCAPVTVIPCCADLDHFNPSSIEPQKKEKLKNQLGLLPEDLVLTYLGSLGTWYKTKEMLLFFKTMLHSFPQTKFLILTPDSPDAVYALATQTRVDPSRLIIRSASRNDVPLYLSITTLSVFFIQPCYSKIASSPTKFAELLGMGIPVITNSGVGDMQALVEITGAGLCLKAFTAADYEKAVSHIPKLLELNKTTLRTAALNYFSLPIGVSRYEAIYRSLL
jgi:glycosyltransferase involved in cell wall biosynthesis